MKLKQIYAALDIGSYDIKLVIGEFHNTRFNVIRVERVQTNGILNYKIVDISAVSQAVMLAVKNVSDLLQVRIERVLLSIPAVNMNRVSQRITVPILHDSKQIMIADIQNAMKLAQRSAVPAGMEIVNVVPVKYIVNGISTRRIPLQETCEVLYVDVDLLCADRQSVYDYVRVVEKSGLEILDIFMQPFAEAKEIAIFEQTVDHHVVYLNIGYQMTTASLFSQGRLVSSELIGFGMEQIDQKISETFHISKESADRLKQYNCRLMEEIQDDLPIYMWTKEQKSYSLSESDLSAVIKESMIDFLEQIYDYASDILQTPKVKVIIGGGGGELMDLPELAATIWKVDVQSYVPETLGARSSTLITSLGLFYAYKDACEYTLSQKGSIDSLKFAEAILPKKPGEEEGFTGRLKNLLFNESERKK